MNVKGFFATLPNPFWITEAQQYQNSFENQSGEAGDEESGKRPAGQNV